ncbi:hypothetical protein HOD29_06500 [archaeon]|jgi:hypothetical protein|nr:hypothetical protein [archaeon]
MPSRKINIYEWVLIGVVILCIFLIVLQSLVLTGYATEMDTPSNVTISKYLAISFSENLTEGILFGDISSLPATNTNATHNYDGVGSATTFYVNVSEDGNTNVDFCLKANAALTNIALDTIGVGNESYANSTITNSSIPLVGNEVSFTTSYVKSGENVAIAGTNYYRFWLDVPVAQPSGNYNNTISFKGIQTGASC